MGKTLGKWGEKRKVSYYKVPYSTRSTCTLCTVCVVNFFMIRCYFTVHSLIHKVRFFASFHNLFDNVKY